VTCGAAVIFDVTPARLSPISPDGRLLAVTDFRPYSIAVTTGGTMTVRLLTTAEVAERFRTSPSTVRYWRHIGIGPAGVRVGRRVLYDEAECDRWWESKAVGQCAHGGS
jgi:predicted DNA-binding transcriptional regulator AlpA